MEIDSLKLPSHKLRPKESIPVFEMLESSDVAKWLKVWKAYSDKGTTELPKPPSVNDCNWPPSGLEKMGDALEWASQNDTQNQSIWQYYHGMWLVGIEKTKKAIDKLEESDTDMANALLGRLYYQSKMINKSKQAFDKIKNVALCMHPQIVVERDKTLEALGVEMLSSRKDWLEKVNASDDEWVIERRIGLLIDISEYDQAKELKENMRFQKIHQRYVRKELWKKLCKKSGMNLNSLPKNLDEDDLAVFGAYRAFED